MSKSDIRVCVVRVGGTNCDAETKRSFENLGVKSEIIHLSSLIKKRNLLEYHILVIPGGFSYGDYVRAGAILAKEIVSKLGKDLKKFLEKERLIFGICNGFQILIESGLLPGFNGISTYPRAALATNFPIGFKCRWIYLKYENGSNCIFTNKIPKGKILRLPIAHGEGRFIFSRDKEEEYLKKIQDNDQLVFRYCNEIGQYAKGKYPVNPNGSFYDIAGICNPDGTVFGLMPHPERAFYGWQLPDWTRNKEPSIYGDGKLIFESVVEYAMKKF